MMMEIRLSNYSYVFGRLILGSEWETIMMGVKAQVNASL